MLPIRKNTGSLFFGNFSFRVSVLHVFFGLLTYLHIVLLLYLFVSPFFREKNRVIKI